MATLEYLKEMLKHKVAAATAAATIPFQKRPLSNSEYIAGFDIAGNSFTQPSYRHFIIPQLKGLLDPLTKSDTRISVLEIGPGPRSVLGGLPWHIRCHVRKYTAFESNEIFATRLHDTFVKNRKKEGYLLPCLESLPDIRQRPFVVGDDSSSSSSSNGAAGLQKYDVILFCHSMYGMHPKKKYIERALEMLAERADKKALVVVFHREQGLRLNGVVCHRSATFPTGVVRVRDDDEVLDQFASFVAGFAVRHEHTHTDAALRMEWRSVCRALGRHEGGQHKQDQDHLVFSSPEIMVAFTKNAMMALQELSALELPLRATGADVKNRHARRHHAACIVRPTEIRHVQECVTWALRHRVGLTVLGGGHSDQCLWPNVVAVDMGAFNQVHVVETNEKDDVASSGFLVVAEAGCTSGDIVRETLAAGLTVPLGSRPSVGAGLWLQGGIGHLARLHGLACDAIVGAVVVSVAASGPVLCIGRVPSRYRPTGSVAADNEADLMWALKGAATNFTIVVSITFRAYAAPVYSVRTWMMPLSDDDDDDNLPARRRKLLGHFEDIITSTSASSQNCSAGAYLYCEEDKLCLGVTLVDIGSASSRTATAFASEAQRDHAPLALTQLRRVFGHEHEHKTVDGVDLFTTELYMSDMHGGHGGGKTSSFKRCLFLPRLGGVAMVDIVIRALEARPSPLCYLHLLQGGGAVRYVAPEATSFGCRDWEYACVVTGVWPRDEDGTEVSRAAVRWVYNVAKDLMPLSCGTYGADLGPDPRDAVLAAKAFGPNRERLVRLKHAVDPYDVLAFACPLTVPPPVAQPLVILVTGEHGVGKDYCAGIWVSIFASYCPDERFPARVVSISDKTKREYAVATGADLDRLLGDRGYKEQHRAAMTAFWQAQLRQRPQLRYETFEKVLTDNADCGVLLITGMRDEAPVAALSHLVPRNRLLEVRVEASRQTRRARRGVDIGVEVGMGDGGDGGNNGNSQNQNQNGPSSNSPETAQDYPPGFIFTNESTGSEAAKQFAQRHLLAFCHTDLERLASMVRPVPDFPRAGIVFRHVLDIVQQPGGLELCTSLLQTHFTGDWGEVDVVACCEAGGFVYASALAMRVGVSLALIREAGKLPAPTMSVTTCPSHISSFTSPAAASGSAEKRLEMGRSAVPNGAFVVVVDDVLASGTTLCAMLQLLEEAGVGAERLHVMVVAEFPLHRGRETLRRRGFGRVKIQSLLILDGV
ncbi:hypothetical protein E4U21_005474 [Claviceps maximensis]|nr:hypothetical protein E4U21_005474 [Claviceps maximensis]